MKHPNISARPLNDNSLADILQQELEQRLLAIRMSAALYSRRNEGRQTQELADQTVAMSDEVIKLFDSLITLMRLPSTIDEQELADALVALQHSMEHCNPLRCIFHDHTLNVELSSSEKSTLFHTLYHTVLQLMLGNDKPHKLTITLDFEELSRKAIISVHHPDDPKSLLRVLTSLQQQQLCTAATLDNPSATLRLEVAAPAQQA